MVCHMSQMGNLYKYDLYIPNEPAQESDSYTKIILPTQRTLSINTWCMKTSHSLLILPLPTSTNVNICKVCSSSVSAQDVKIALTCDVYGCDM